MIYKKFAWGDYVPHALLVITHKMFRIQSSLANRRPSRYFIGGKLEKRKNKNDGGIDVIGEPPFRASSVLRLGNVVAAAETGMAIC